MLPLIHKLIKGNIMKLSKATLDVLKNFGSISNSLIIHQGSRIRTRNEKGEQIAFANVDEEFPIDVPIYDVGEFLSALALVEDAELSFEEDCMTMSNTDTSLNFSYAKREFIKEAPESMKFPTGDVVEFTLTKSVLDSVLKASSVLGLPEISVYSKEDEAEIYIGAVDPSGKITNTFEISVGSTDVDNSFEFFFKDANLQIIRQDYDVTIHPAGISRFEGTNIDYYIALEAH